jgi:oxygen-independent coproporphyrinogen-3 oxidase
MRNDGQPTGGFGLYVHWPFCRSKCPYCDFNSHVREGIDQERWARALVRELHSIAARLEARPRLDTVFFGGGTPSLMAPATVASILDAAAALFPLADDLEVTLEANPTSSEAESFAGFRAAGVNRLSLGVQSLDDAALKFLGRQHSAAEAIAALELARACFPRLSFDLIYARPDQSPAAWRAELSRAIDLAADHLSLYQLTIEPGTKFATLVDHHFFAPAPEALAADLFDLTQDVTAAAGLPAYEISNHARSGAQSRHNLIYWRSGAWLGIGPGAHGRLPAGGDRRIATETERFPERWLARVEEAGHGLVLFEPVEEYDQAKELLLMSLRLSEGTDITLVRTRAADLLDEKALQRLVADRFIERDGTRIRAAAKGRLVLNRVIAELVRERRIRRLRTPSAFRRSPAPG